MNKNNAVKIGLGIVGAGLIVVLLTKKAGGGTTVEHKYNINDVLYYTGMGMKYVIFAIVEEEQAPPIYRMVSLSNGEVYDFPIEEVDNSPDWTLEEPTQAKFQVGDKIVDATGSTGLGALIWQVTEIFTLAGVLRYRLYQASLDKTESLPVAIVDEIFELAPTNPNTKFQIGDNIYNTDWPSEWVPQADYTIVDIEWQAQPGQWLYWFQGGWSFWTNVIDNDPKWVLYTGG